MKSKRLLFAFGSHPKRQAAAGMRRLKRARILKLPTNTKAANKIIPEPNPLKHRLEKAWRAE